MSLIRCPECGEKVSSKANSCPNCGLPDPANPAATKRMKIKEKEKQQAVGCLILVSCLILSLFFPILGIIAVICSGAYFLFTILSPVR